MTINRIYFEARTSLNSYYSIIWNSNLKRDTELPPYLKFVAYLNFKNFVIEICKLLKNTDNEHYNLFSFINNLKNNEIYRVEIKVLEELEERLKEIGKVYVDDLTQARNKVYAHTDENHKSIDKVLGNDKTQPVMKTVSDIIDYLNCAVNISPTYRYNIHENFGEFEFYDEVIKKIVLKE